MATMNKSETTPSDDRRPSGLVRVTIPLLTDQEGAGKVDQTETVIINGYVTRIQRGQQVEVSPAVYEALRVAYPNL